MSAYLDWKVGDKIVCVDADDTSADGVREIHEGSVYTIRWIGWYLHALSGEILGVRLEGISRPADTPEESEWFSTFGEAPFHVRRFRRAETNKTDISLFRALLHPSEHDKKALIEHERREDAEVLADGLYGEVKFS